MIEYSSKIIVQSDIEKNTSKIFSYKEIFVNY